MVHSIPKYVLKGMFQDHADCPKKRNANYGLTVIFCRAIGINFMGVILVTYHSEDFFTLQKMSRTDGYLGQV